MPRERGSNGIALLEVLAALALLGISGAALVRYIGEAAAVAQRSAAREAEITRASSVLARLGLERSSELLARAGVSRLDDLEIRIERVGIDLFRVEVRDTRGGVELLATHLLAPARESSDAP